LGISIVTDVCLTGEERLARIPLDRYFPKRSYGIVLREGRFLSPQAKRFIEIMESVFVSPGDAASDGAPDLLAYPVVAGEDLQEDAKPFQL